MENLVQLNKLKAESFQQVRNAIEALKSQAQEAQASHQKDAASTSLYDAAAAWQNIARSDAFDKGKKAGYAEACGDMIIALEAIKNQVDDQQAVIQKMISDLEDEETVDVSIEENTEDPLD